MNKEYYQQYNREHREKKRLWMWKKRHGEDWQPKPAGIDPHAKDKCVRCRRPIPKLLYAQNGNFCHFCITDISKTVLWANLDFEESKEPEIEKETNEYLARAEKRSIFAELDMKKSDVQICLSGISPKCTGKFVPTKRAPNECLLCYWARKLDKSVIHKRNV